MRRPSLREKMDVLGGPIVINTCGRIAFLFNLIHCGACPSLAARIILIIRLDAAPQRTRTFFGGCPFWVNS